MEFQDELGISEDEFEDLQCLFQVGPFWTSIWKEYIFIVKIYDHDKDGILNFKGTQKVLKCLGLRLSEEEVESVRMFQKMLLMFMQAQSIVSLVSCDHHGYSVSFNEYLQLVSLQRRREPDEQIMIEVFR